MKELMQEIINCFKKSYAQMLGRYYCPFCNKMLPINDSIVLHLDDHYHPKDYIF